MKRGSTLATSCHVVDANLFRLAENRCDAVRLRGGRDASHGVDIVVRGEQATPLVRLQLQEIERFPVRAEVDRDENLLRHVSRDDSPETDHGFPQSAHAPPQEMRDVRLLGTEDFQTVRCGKTEVRLQHTQIRTISGERKAKTFKHSRSVRPARVTASGKSGRTKPCPHFSSCWGSSVYSSRARRRRSGCCCGSGSNGFACAEIALTLMRAMPQKPNQRASAPRRLTRDHNLQICAALTVVASLRSLEKRKRALLGSNPPRNIQTEASK